MSEKTVSDTSEPVGTETSTGSATSETSIGLDENVASAVAYLFGFVSGVVLLLVETENRTVRFHAAQSIVFFAGVVAASMAIAVFGFVLDLLLGGLLGFVVSLGFSLLSLVVSLVVLVGWVFLVVRAYQGANPRLPVVAGIADGLVK